MTHLFNHHFQYENPMTLNFRYPFNYNMYNFPRNRYLSPFFTDLHSDEHLKQYIGMLKYQLFVLKQEEKTIIEMNKSTLERISVECKQLEEKVKFLENQLISKET